MTPFGGGRVLGVRIFRNPVASSSWYFSTLQPRHWRVGDQTPPSWFCVLIFHLGNGQIRLMERGRWQGCPVFSSLTPHPRLLPLSLQEALHARDKKRVNKLLFFSQDWPGWFNPSSHLPYPHPTRPPLSVGSPLSAPGKVRWEAASTRARSQAPGHAVAALTD